MDDGFLTFGGRAVDEHRPETYAFPAVPASLQGEGAMARRILLIDDEPLVCDFACAALGARGWVVDTAASAGEARRDELARQDYQLIVCDVELPDGDGIALAQELRERWPGIAVVLTSGWPERYEDHASLRRPGFRFLPKPFSMAELLAAVEGPPPAAPGAALQEDHP
jgi:DNA-binding NtrC family response regulator